MRSLILNRIVFFLLGGAIFCAGFLVSDMLEVSDNNEENRFDELYVDKTIYIGGGAAMIGIRADPEKEVGILIMDNRNMASASISIDRGIASLNLRGAGSVGDSPSITLESDENKSEVFVSGTKYINYFRSDTNELTRRKKTP